ncbi:MAG: methyltransferase domain-containing protein [Thermodesulfobacteriota bacterium]
MKRSLNKKSSVEEIKERFDNDVERFSNLETGQQAVVDAPIMLELISELAASVKPDARNILDIGSGAGNNTISILREIKGVNCDLVDISLPMLEKAKERISKEQGGEVRIFHGDFRDVALPNSHYDLIVAAAVLHHLRDDADWENCFLKIYNLLNTGGAFFISDMVHHQHSAIHNAMWDRYGEHLESVGGHDYRDKVFEYIEVEDSPRSLSYQLELMKKVGFTTVDVLHKNSCFAAFVGIK